MRTSSVSLLLGTLLVGTGSLFSVGCASSQSTEPAACPADAAPAPSDNQTPAAVAATQPVPAVLASWNDTESKRAILQFVAQVTEPGEAQFLPPEARVAVFDNDGTLWVEKPLYTQLAFALDRVKALSAQHPEWKKKAPFRAVLENDTAALSKLGPQDLLQLIAATHGGMTSEELRVVVSQWLATAKHPQLNRPYTELVYQPMLELMDLLRKNGFKTYIVTGGGVDFVRAFAETVYGVPPEQVIGSTMNAKYDATEASHPAVRSSAELHELNDGPAKAVAIERIIGRRPVAAFGNSDGDYEMLAWTTSGSGLRLGMLVHHTDEVREFAYDRESSVGKLLRGLDDAGQRGWILINMKTDWAKVFR